MLEQLAGLTVYPRSVTRVDGATFFLARSPQGKVLGILGDAAGFEGERQGDVLLCPLTSANAATLRVRLPWLRPVPLGFQTSAGFGDRLGLATPGHVRAVRAALEMRRWEGRPAPALPAGASSSIAPIFAQQSVRENARTGRTPQQVLDDATWGLFQEGWRDPWGADADHLKSFTDVDAFVAAGYTFYTIDPGDYVDDAASTAPPAEVEAKVRSLPWETLEDTLEDMEKRYLDRSFDLEGCRMMIDRPTLWLAAARYGRAIAHTVQMYRHLASRMGDHAPSTGSGHSFELEVSVDETEMPTSLAEHLFIASELRRSGVRWVSLAPRFIGRFEKGVDYIGDLTTFSTAFAWHTVVARALGPYKLSLHSGSDKFSIYPIVARMTEGLVHLKTAGTSYLEALRAIADTDPTLFRDVLAFAHRRYDEDKATYHVSASPDKVPLPDTLTDGELTGVLDLFDARQVLHVTFGSVLERFGSRLKEVLAEHEEAHYAALETHFRKHLAPFAQRA